MDQKIIIAIDGHSACGKSTLAKSLAEKLGYLYINTGAMYRAVTLFFIREKVDLADAQAVQGALGRLSIRFERNEAGIFTYLNGENVEEEIRKMYVSEWVSPVSAIPEVRRAMVKQQQEMGRQKGVVLEGRDIGTVVFPEAELKIFLTAHPDTRSQRRFQELQQKGIPAELEAVRRNLLERDHIDSTRADSPLRKATDAVVIDNTSLNESEQLEWALELAFANGASVPPLRKSD